MSDRALLVIDVQKEYFAGGAWALPESENRLPNILRLIESAREREDVVIFVQHIAPAESPVFAKGSTGSELHDQLAPREEDPIIQKNHPSAFMDTSLEMVLTETGIRQLDICGFMTQMCCDTTTRAAYGRGYKVRFFSDATAARDVTFQGEVIPHDTVHKATLATLARFAEVITTDQG